MSIAQEVTKIKNPRYHGNEMPQFYKDGLADLRMANQNSSDAYDNLNNTPRWMQAERKLAVERYNLYFRLACDASERTAKLMAHWQELLAASAEECECTPERVCRSCIARMRLDDPQYEPRLEN